MSLHLPVPCHILLTHYPPQRTHHAHVSHSSLGCRRDVRTLAANATTAATMEGEAVPASYFSARNGGTDDMPIGMKLGIAGSAFAGAAAVYIGLFLFNAERRRRQNINLGRTSSR